jgi:hypothetical protein
MSTMHVLDSGGDTKIMWNADNPDEVAAAKAHFKSLRDRHYLAFKAEGREGTRGSQIDHFDPDLERIIMVPRSVGG